MPIGENFLAALEWSWQEGDVIAATRLVVIQTTSWMCMGDAQGREWLERVLAEPEPAVHPARARALIQLALSLMTPDGPAASGSTAAPPSRGDRRAGG